MRSLTVVTGNVVRGVLWAGLTFHPGAVEELVPGDESGFRIGQAVRGILVYQSVVTFLILCRGQLPCPESRLQ